MRDNNTGQFLKTPKGSKTPKMLEVEKYLSELEGKNTTLEEDYKKYYIEKGWGQKKLADRWRASRGHIFGNHMKDGRQSWVKILSLTKRNATTSGNKKTNTKYICENCGDDAPLHGAHFIPKAEGGSNKPFNIIKLCGSCHNKFDLRNDKKLHTSIMKTLLRREVLKIINSNDSLENQKDEIYKIVKYITIDGKKYRNF